MSRKLIVFAAISAALVLLVLASRFIGGDSAKTVEVTPVQSQVVRSAVLASGQLIYRDQVQLRSELIGRAARVPFEQGDRVSAGDVIVGLEPDQFRAQLDQQEANVRLQQIAIDRQRLMVDNLQRQVERTRELFNRQLVDANSQENAENELQMARLDLSSRQEALTQARAALAQSRDNLDRTEIRSPIDGIVIQLDVKPGESVIAGTTNIPGSTIAIIADTSSMLAKLQVDEADIARVSVDQIADIYAAAFPDTPLQGVVEKIATTARRADGQQNLSFEVDVRLLDADRVDVRSGMSARAEIFTESSEDALALPIQAVQYDDDSDNNRDNNRDSGEEQSFVFVDDNGTARRRAVRTGLSSDSHIEILDGLEAGERVVTGPFRTLRSLRDGDSLRAAEAGATTPAAD
ncbi:MAG: efflux RND transporter periplasmic adaptor subunit [Wenzhouxiangellaceae bacterium]